MKYLKLKDEIVLIDNILHVEMKENTIEILYGINVPEQGNKFYGHVLDYSEVKNDVNEEKTKIEQDYEKLMNNLNVDNLDNAYKHVITERNILIDDMKKLLNKKEDLIKKIYNSTLGLTSNKKKIEKIKEIINNEV